jgi:hypothetical protein
MYITVHYKTLPYTTVCYKTVNYKTGQHYRTVRLQNSKVHSHKSVHVTQWYITKRYSYKMVHYKTVHRHHGMLHNSTLQSQPTGLHQPMDWLGIKPNLTQPWIGSVTINRMPPTHGLVGRWAYPNLTLDMVSHNQQNSTNLFIYWVGGVLFIVTDHFQS